jgi:hypothetical protein
VWKVIVRSWGAHAQCPPYSTRVGTTTQTASIAQRAMHQGTWQAPYQWGPGV